MRFLLKQSVTDWIAIASLQLNLKFSADPTTCRYWFLSPLLMQGTITALYECMQALWPPEEEGGVQISEKDIQGLSEEFGRLEQYLFRYSSKGYVAANFFLALIYLFAKNTPLLDIEKGKDYLLKYLEFIFEDNKKCLKKVPGTAVYAMAEIILEVYQVSACGFNASKQIGLSEDMFPWKNFYISLLQHLVERERNFFAIDALAEIYKNGLYVDVRGVDFLSHLSPEKSIYCAIEPQEELFEHYYKMQQNNLEKENRIIFSGAFT